MEEEHHGMEEGLMKMQRNLLELAGTAGWNSILLMAQSSTDTRGLNSKQAGQPVCDGQTKGYRERNLSWL